MITVAFSTRKIDPSFVELLKKTSGIKSLEVLPFENNGEYSLTQVYNMALEKSSKNNTFLFDCATNCNCNIKIKDKDIITRKIFERFIVLINNQFKNCKQ